MYPSNPHCKGLCGEDQIIPLGDLVPYIDIIIFAVIAVLLVLRLRSVLGQRTGYEEQPQRDNRFDKGTADVISIDSGRRAAVIESRVHAMCTGYRVQYVLGTMYEYRYI